MTEATPEQVVAFMTNTMKSTPEQQIEWLTMVLAQQLTEIERLQTALQWLMKQPWKSIDKDNMEYQVTVSCYVRDALLAALEPKP